MLLPDGVSPIGAAHEEVVLALRHHDVGILHGSQLSCIRDVSRGWGLRRVEGVEKRVRKFVRQFESI